MMRIAALQSDELEEVAYFVASLNTQPAHNISYFGTQADEILASLQEFTPPPTKSVLILRNGESIAGMFGFDADEDKRRAWLYGPLVADETRWDEFAGMLYHALLPRIPAAITDFEMVFDTRNHRAQHFASAQGFAQASEDVVLRFTRADSDSASMSDDGTPLRESDYVGFTALHDRLFPRTYYSGQEIIKRLDEHSRVFVIHDAHELVGYVYAQVQPDFGEGYIDFIGVAEHARGVGFGTRLLQQAMRWVFSFDEVQEISLTVGAANQAAVRLYRKAGFTEERRIIAFRKRR